jgi:hypothetical protein
MKLGPVALKLRASNTRFGDRIAGAAEFGSVRNNTVNYETLFVIPLTDTVPDNSYDTSINQNIRQGFAVIVALLNDTSQADKLGLLAFDKIHDVRAEIWSSILGWEPPESDGVIGYAGGRLLAINRAWLWWQFDFEIDIRICDEDGFDNESDSLPLFEKAWTQYKLNPEDGFSMGGVSIPLPSDEVDAEQLVDE